MNEEWRNRLLYWALATVPLTGLYAVAIASASLWFVLYLLFYILIYRPLIDTQRLISLRKIEEKDAWKFFIPLYISRIQYTRSLWWGS